MQGRLEEPVRPPIPKYDQLVIPSEHRKKSVLVSGIHEAMQIASPQHYHVSRSHRPYFKASLALRHSAPVAHHHPSPPLHHQKNFGIIAVAMEPIPQSPL